MDYTRGARWQQRTPRKETRRKAKERRRPPNHAEGRTDEHQSRRYHYGTGRSRTARTPPRPRRDVAQSGVRGSELAYPGLKQQAITASSVRVEEDDGRGVLAAHGSGNQEELVCCSEDSPPVEELQRQHQRVEMLRTQLELFNN
ncbi:hypothetical protein NDU88_001548 [Pleurodeles waltl]|uniref:Uncharacterized protein n=1 Tax=Pleurodeles waltl TaxID=8319 RepID=A0AAV7L9W3_PLEWA|nr:hypothetical protein NDU88_001548 [Pleurodeles waltl]